MFAREGAGETRTESGISGSGRTKVGSLVIFLATSVLRESAGEGVISHEAGRGTTGGTGSNEEGRWGPIIGRPETGVSGGTPYNSRMLHVVEAERTTTGEVGEFGGSTVFTAKLREGALVRPISGEITDWPVLGDEGGENSIGDGSPNWGENVLPWSQIVDN